MDCKSNYSVQKKTNRSVCAFERAFLDLLEEQDCSKISINNILKESGYSRTAFYSNFNDKRDFIDQIIQKEISNHVQCIYGSIRENANELFDRSIYLPALHLFQHVYKQRKLYHMLLGNKIEGWSGKRFAAECWKYFDELLRVYPVGYQQLDYSLYSYVETYRYINFITYWDLQSFRFTPEYMAEQAGIMMHIQSIQSINTVEILSKPR